MRRPSLPTVISPIALPAASGRTSVGNGYGRVDVAPTGNVTWWPGVATEVDGTGLDEIGFWSN